MKTTPCSETQKLPSELRWSQQIWSFLLLVLAIALNVWALLPSLQDEGLHHSDLSFHLSILKALDATVKAGGNPLDFWYDGSPFGFALFRSYQNLPYLITYSVYRVLGESLSLDYCMRCSVVLLAALLPISVFLTARAFTLPRFDAGVAGLLSSLVSEVGNFGLGLQNYTFGTGGMLTQLWAVVVMGPAIALSIEYLGSGKRYILALAAVFLCFGSHVVSAFIIFFAVGLYVFVDFITSARKTGELSTVHRCTVRRCVSYGLGVLLVTAYQWVFVFLDGRYINQSVVEPAYKYGSHGIRWVTEQLWTGALFDEGRFPSISILLIFGFFAVAYNGWKMRKGAPMERQSVVWLWLAASFVLSLSLLAGWEIWGSIFKNTPVLRSLHMHRFIIAVNFFGIVLAAFGFYALRSLLPNRAQMHLVAVATLLLALKPCFEERIARYSQAQGWRATVSEAWSNDADLRALLEHLRQLPRTFVHPGMHQTWADTLRLGGMVPLHDITLASGFPTMGGMLFHAFSLAGDTMFNFSVWRKGTADLFGVGVVIAPEDLKLPEYLKRDATFGKYAVYTTGATRLGVMDIDFTTIGTRREEPSFMQRWVSSSLVDKSVFGLIPTRSSIDTSSQGLPTVDLSTDAPALPAHTQVAGRVESEGAWSPSGISGEVQLNRNAFCLFKTGYHPNWRAYVDGILTDTAWVTPGFVAVPVQFGKHSVSFHYVGSYLKVLLFLFTLAFFCIAPIALQRRRRVTGSQ